jgi:aspartate/methionine/tyrosine aminotransferase
MLLLRPLRAAAVSLTRRGVSSTRGEGVAGFKVMEVLNAANVLEAGGADVLHMEVGQPSTPAPPTARRTAEASLARDEALGYTSANGLPAVKEKIAKWYLDRHGSTVDPARIVVTTGSSAGFILSFLALFDASDLVGVPSTAYPCYRNVLKVLGVTPVALAGDAANPRSGFGFPTPADVTADLKGLILSSPSNPTGATLSADELATLAAHCKSNGVKFISDEIYHHIVYGDETSASAVDMEGALVINSFSKYFSMTGWRIGWLVLPKDDPSLSSAIEKLQQNLFINAPHISQIAAAASFDDVDDVLEGHVAVYERNRQVVLDALEKMGVDPDHIAPAKGAFYVYVDLMAFGVTDAPDLCFRLLNDTGVAITPGVDFEFDESIGRRRVRISYCGAPAAVAAAMDRLTDWWAAGKYK